MDSFHLDSSSFHVHGDYGTGADDEAEAEAKSGLITITYGYSRDHRPDLKQFLLDLMCSGDGDIPLYLRVADGNEVDSAMFGKLIADFQKQWQIDALFVADAALYTEENLQQRVAALAMVMGLCLLVYSLGQRALRQSLERASQTIQNQLGKPTSTPTLRWVFQCFMSIHLLTIPSAMPSRLIASLKQISNLTEERCWILQFFGAPCRKYYLLC